MDYFDEDGYPTQEILAVIQGWQWGDAEGCFDFVRELWQYPHLWRESNDGENRLFKISTGGWSGNESLISAMERNQMIWVLTWVSSRRGGHYEFEIQPMSS